MDLLKCKNLSNRIVFQKQGTENELDVDEMRSPAGEYHAKSSLFQYGFHILAPVALYLDIPAFERPANSATLLDPLFEIVLLFFGNPNEIRGNRHPTAAARRALPHHIDAPAILLFRFAKRRWTLSFFLRRLALRQTAEIQSAEWIAFQLIPIAIDSDPLASSSHNSRTIIETTKRMRLSIPLCFRLLLGWVQDPFPPQMPLGISPSPSKNISAFW